MNWCLCKWRYGTKKIAHDHLSIVTIKCMVFSMVLVKFTWTSLGMNGNKRRMSTCYRMMNADRSFYRDQGLVWLDIIPLWTSGTCSLTILFSSFTQAPFVENASTWDSLRYMNNPEFDFAGDMDMLLLNATSWLLRPIFP